jgi:hypothetical protein
MSSRIFRYRKKSMGIFSYLLRPDAAKKKKAHTIRRKQKLARARRVFQERGTHCQRKKTR